MMFSPQLLAEFDVGRSLGAGLTAAIVPLALGLLYRSAQKESNELAGSQSIAYPKAMRVFVIGSWVFTVFSAVLLEFTFKNDLLANFSIVGFFVALILPLHLEVFGVSITWDRTNIYTRSPWRRRRTIPFSAVKSCDYSASMQWYRVYTDGYGIIRLHSLMRGIPDLLRVLRCVTPPYPPN